MTIQRRGFLAAMLAAAAAPAIVKASSLMQISAPKLVLPASMYGVAVPPGDVTLEGWVMEAARDGEWHHVAFVRSDRGVRHYLDGELVHSPREAERSLRSLVAPIDSGFRGHIDDIRLTSADRYGSFGFIPARA